MKRVIIFTLFVSLPFILAQCAQDNDRNYMMGEGQMSRIMENPE
jgi:hypothetical protein